MPQNHLTQRKRNHANDPLPKWILCWAVLGGLNGAANILGNLPAIATAVTISLSSPTATDFIVHCDGIVQEAAISVPALHNDDHHLQTYGLMPKGDGPGSTPTGNGQNEVGSRYPSR